MNFAMSARTFSKPSVSRTLLVLFAMLALQAGQRLIAEQVLPESRGQKQLEPASSISDTKFRGFTLSRLDSETLKDAKGNWNINIVRQQLGINRPKSADDIDWRSRFDATLQRLSEGLDNAKALNLTVVIAIPQLLFTPEDREANRNELSTAFWKDEKNLQNFREAWTKIATLCKSRNQNIWFDLMNEPLDRKALPSYPKEWPDWAQTLIDTIREIDKVHPIVVEIGPGGLCWGFRDFPSLKGEGIIYSFHQYQPHAYTHQGIADIRNTDLAKAYLDRQLHWPGTFNDHGGGVWDQNRVTKELEPVFAFIKRNPGAHIYVGEFSVVRWAPDGAQYLRDNIEIFEKFGWDWTYHAFREFSGWSLEHTSEYSDPAHAPKALECTDRGQVVRGYTRRNLQDLSATDTRKPRGPGLRNEVH
jgi:hypothetical protein